MAKLRAIKHGSGASIAFKSLGGLFDFGSHFGGHVAPAGGELIDVCRAGAGAIGESKALFVASAIEPEFQNMHIHAENLCCWNSGEPINISRNRG